MPSLDYVWKESVRYLDMCGVPESFSVCEILLAHILQCPRLDLPGRRTEEIPEEQLVGIRAGIKRLGTQEPVQYVIGEWDFRTVTLRTDSRALIPRPETEQLVDLVLASPVWRRVESPVVVDIGTGTGAIILSLGVEARRGTFIGVDVSEPALALAQENAVRCGLTKKITFRIGDALDGFMPGSLDLIVSNPPYIASEIVDGLEKHIREFEPRSALDGGPDGLDILRRIICSAVVALRPQGWIYFEIGDDQGDSVRKMLEDSGFSQVGITRDYSSRIRFACGCLPG